ncbi:TetR/AcrR family transcriptional regulator [Marinobacter sp.]|uniref:TetR/AcrR family transcriptional regulator n=1 Tax=Marinobacter sp. TaxID=50741 RepID=UPI003A8E0E58
MTKLKRKPETRKKLVSAALKIYTSDDYKKLSIDEIITHANVSRGTFYNHFQTIEEVLSAISHDFSDQMVSDILPMYDILKEPWQRISVGYRLFLVRALLDRKWAMFVTRHEAWEENTLVASYVSKDIELGKSKGNFCIESTEAATDFLMGASAKAIERLIQGVENPGKYIDTQVRMIISSMGCNSETSEMATEFSLTYLRHWAKGTLQGKPRKPNWARNIESKEGNYFLNND